MACCAKLGLLPGRTGVVALLTGAGAMLGAFGSCVAAGAETLLAVTIKLATPAGAAAALGVSRTLAGSTTSLATTGLGVMAADTEAVLLLNW
jgi:hypothetical protein